MGHQGNSDEKGRYYFIEYLNSEVGINGNKIKAFLPKYDDGTSVDVTKVKDLGIIEETFMNEVTRTYAVEVEGNVPSIKLYEYNNGFVSGGEVKQLSDVQFKVVVKALVTPKHNFLDDLEEIEDLPGLIK